MFVSFITLLKGKVAGRAIDELRRTNGGSITPALLVDAARSPAHPLHNEFDWDDSAAAERWRQQQARVLINCVRVIVTGGDGPATRVAYVSVQTRDDGKAYLPSSVVLSDVEYRDQAIAEALSILEGWKRRFAHLEELAEVFAVIDRVRDRHAPKKG